jgi:hypothetical protein
MYRGRKPTEYQYIYIYILFNLIAGALGLNVSSGEVIRFELRFDTLTAIGSLEFEPDYCLPTSVASATAINTINVTAKSGEIRDKAYCNNCRHITKKY